MTTIKDAIKNNIFGFYSNEKEYQTATIEIKDAVDKLIELMREYKNVGAKDTESRESIINYLTEELYK
jgi:hypothetical protein